jgi:hypothetical protein
MEENVPLLDRDTLRAFMERHRASLLPVRAAEEGRFILYLPDFKDSKGPVLAPNIKELEAKMRGSDGFVESIELEAGPQKIPADGTNVLVINRVDPFIQMALSAKLTDLIDDANGEFTRNVLNEFMGYARGYTYDPETQKITFAKNVGFRNDVYNMPVAEFKKRYVRHSRPDLSLEEVKDHNIRSGYYIKKPLLGRGMYLQGKYKVPLPSTSGGAMQEFNNGAMVNLPDDSTLPISFIHITDINACYTKPNRWPLVDADGRHALPVYNLAQVPQQKSSVRKKFPRRTPKT